MNLILALGGGILVGVIFSAVHIPLPAPPTLAGILATVGVFLGYQVYHLFSC
ncbi:MAG: hypothetical protein H6Q74_1664 [Firmicutes bacterium]|nr:hypothetical protein [Bacillota bacterium]